MGAGRFLLWDHTGFREYLLRGKIGGLEEVPCGTLVELIGYPKDGEMQVEKYRILHKPASDICFELPGDPFEYAKRYVEYLRHPKVLRALLVYSSMLQILRGFLLKKGFVELPPAIIGQASDPGLRGARRAVVELYGERYELHSSLIMYKQLYASVLGKVFYVARNIRVEPVENASTGRHLVEFTQIDAEIADAELGDMVALGENAIYRSVKKLLSTSAELIPAREVDRLEREIAKPPYPRLLYEEALEELTKLGYEVKPGEELSFDAEVALASHYGTPVWVVGYPTSARGFYNREDPARPGHNLDYNLLLPGIGEVLDGGCREYRKEAVVEKISRCHNEDPARYKWFIDILEKREITPTCGWGIGLERLVKYVLNLEHIVYASPHPRLPGIIGP